MAKEPTPDQQAGQLKKDVDLLTQQLERLKAQTALDSARQTQDARSAKILLDALKDQIASQSALGVAQAQLPFAELQGIKAGISGLTLPSGKDGTVIVAAGTAGTALLRSKRPMLELLDKAAGELVPICRNGAVLLTEAQLAQAYAAQFTLKRIDDEKTKLANAATKANRGIGTHTFSVVTPIAAGAYALGFTLDTINSLAKLLRTDRKLDVFGADTEAVQMLGYLLESRSKGFVANPAMLGDTAVDEADSLLERLQALGEQVHVANDTLDKIKTYSDAIAKATPEDPIKKAPMPTEADVSSLKAAIEEATSLLDGLHPTKKPDMFWAQVSGQVLAANIKGKRRLFIEAKAQTVQVTESRWGRRDRILATGEVQVAYRLLTADGSVEKSGVILMVSGTDGSRIDKLEALEWKGSTNLKEVE